MNLPIYPILYYMVLPITIPTTVSSVTTAYLSNILTPPKKKGKPYIVI